MKRTYKTMLVAAALACGLLLASCSGGALSGKYDSIVRLDGYATIAYQDGVQRVFKKNKATGDKAFAITKTVGRGDFFVAKKTADSGVGLMDKNGKFIKYEGPKLLDLTANIVVWTEKSSKGVYEGKYEINYFVATLDMSEEKDAVVAANNYAIMTPAGKLLDGRYSSIGVSGSRVATATKLEKDGANPAVTYTCVLRATGDQIGRKIPSAAAGDFYVENNGQTGNAIVSVKKEAADTNGNNYDVFKGSDGSKISDAFSYAEDTGSLGVFVFSKRIAPAPAEPEIWIIKRDYNSEKRAEESKDSYTYNDVHYTIEGKTSDDSFKLKTVNETTLATTDKTSGYKSWDVFSYYLRAKTSSDKYDYMLKDGTAIKSGVDSTKADFELTMYNQYTGDFGYIVRDDRTVEAKIAGVSRTKTLTANETATLYAANGYVTISNTVDSPNYTKLWIPYTDTTVEYTSISPLTPISLTVKKDGKEYYYRTLTRNIKYWDGSLTNGNLLTDLGGLSSEADLETVKFAAVPSVSFTLSGNAATPTPKASSYADSHANNKAAYAESVKRARGIGYGSVTFTLKNEDPAKEEKVTFNALAYGLNDNYTKYSIKNLGKDEERHSTTGPFAVTRSTKEGFKLVSKVWKVEVNKNGAAELKEIISGLNDAAVNADGLYNYYIMAAAANSTKEIYSDSGKLMLKGGLFQTDLPNNYNIRVNKPDGNYGIAKLNKKGGYKLIKKLEWTSAALFLDGSFLVKNNDDDRYAQLCSASGSVLEKNAVTGAGVVTGLIGQSMTYLGGSRYNVDKVENDGAKELIKLYEVKTGAGASKIYTIKIDEKSLDFAIKSLYSVM